ncbi:MAG: RNA polymerase sigma-54 factor, partial [Candidatus Omnitrophica bacterium]|nr:RNA polymerase sigma-54 factor [Candidatus Omnitrophota bacterium]
LNPKPGRLFSGDLPPSVIPDLIVTRRDRHYDVELNDQGMPRVGINRSYHRMLKDPETPEDAKEFLLKKFRQASWIVKSIDERNATLLSIGRCLISLQRDFVEQGPKALKPLTQSQVASLIGRHASTVSRAIAGKSLDTPYGVFRLEQLFASGVPQNPASHADISDATIKSEIQRLINEEDAQHPFSDEALAQQLAQRDITVARRTIAKYRTSLKILPAHLRKRRG